jgi:hypothetical protein
VSLKALSSLRRISIFLQPRGQRETSVAAARAAMSAAQLGNSGENSSI